MIKIFLDKGADVNALCNSGSDRRIIHAGAAHGSFEALNLIIDGGADVNQRDDAGWAPLHSAAFFGHKETVKALVSRGADVRAVTEGGTTALKMAEGEGHHEIASWLRSNFSPASGPNR